MQVNQKKLDAGNGKAAGIKKAAIKKAVAGGNKKAIKKGLQAASLSNQYISNNILNMNSVTNKPMYFIIFYAPYPTLHSRC